MTSDELKLAAEYNRGWQDSKKAKSAEKWWLTNNRKEVVRKLREVKLDGESSHEKLSEICECIYPTDWWTRGACMALREELIGLLGGNDGTCPNANGTRPNGVPNASITAELREYIWQHATNNDELRAIADRIDQAHADAMQSVHDELAIELAKTKELLEISYAKRRAYKLHIDQMKGGSKRWRKRYEDAQTLAEVIEQECNDLLELLRDAAKEYKMREGVLDAALAKLKDSIELPKDRDGKTWHLGDSILYEGKAVTVDALCLREDGWTLESDIYSFAFDASCCIHAPAHTAESIVRDLTLGKISESEAVRLIEELRDE